MPCRTIAPGPAGSVFDIVDNPRLNHRVAVVSGVLHDEAAAQLNPLLHAAASGAGRGAQCQRLGCPDCVIPAFAGIQRRGGWIPACAGMTVGAALAWYAES